MTDKELDYFCKTTDRHTAESLNEHIRKRLLLLTALKGDQKKQQAVYAVCKRDPVFFINNFCYTNFPRNPNGIADCPFVLYEFQEWSVVQWVENIINGDDFLVEKSREMGISWLVAAIFLWFFLFCDDFTGLLGSYKLDYVDTGGVDPNTHMGRIMYMLTKLPKWMQPAYERKEGKITNTENNSIIKGETSTENFARAGRYKAVLLDELAFWDMGNKSFGSCRQSAHTRIVVSTPNGENNDFFRIRNKLARNKVPYPNLDEIAKQKGLIDALVPYEDTDFISEGDEEELEELDSMMRRYRLHWVLHPAKDVDWYNKEKQFSDRDTIARELDISYKDATSAQVFKDYNPDIHLHRKAYQVKKVLPVYRIWDFGSTSCVLYLQVDEENRVHIFHERVLQEEIEGTSAIDLQIERAKYDTRILCPKNNIIDICDPAGNQKNHRATSTDIRYLNGHGFFPQFKRIQSYNTRTRKKNCAIMLRSDLTKVIKRKACINVYIGDDHGCPILHSALNGAYAYKVNRQGKVDFDQVDEKHPYEDVMDCLFYFYVESGRLDGLPVHTGKSNTHSMFQPVKLKTNFKSGYYF